MPTSPSLALLRCLTHSLLPVTREVDVVHDYGKKRYTEKVITTLVGVPDLLTCNWFNPTGSKANTTKKDYEPIPLTHKVNFPILFLRKAMSYHLKKSFINTLLRMVA